MLFILEQATATFHSPTVLRVLWRIMSAGKDLVTTRVLLNCIYLQKEGLCSIIIKAIPEFTTKPRIFTDSTIYTTTPLNHQ